MPVGKLLEKNKKKKNIFFASLKSMKKVFGSGVGSGAGTITERYGSGVRGSVSALKCHRSPTLVPVVFRSLSQIMSLEREVEEGREKERQLERERHDMERQINARSETFLHFT